MSATTDPVTESATEREEIDTTELTDAERVMVRGDATEEDARARAARESRGSLQVPARRRYDESLMAVLRATVFRGLSATELALALEIAARYHLDPSIGELFAAHFDGSDKITVWAGRDGLLKAARLTGELLHVESHVVREKDTFMVSVDSDKIVVGDDGMTISGVRELLFEQSGMGTAARGRIVGAFALVWRKGDPQPWFAQAAWDDYGEPRQTDGDGNPTNWTEGEGFTEAMMIKVPQSIALRMCFGLTGLYSEEEVWKLRERNRQDAAGTAGDGASAGLKIRYPASELGLTVQALIERVKELKPGTWPVAKIARRVNDRSEEELNELAAELKAQVAKLEPTSDLLGRAAEQVKSVQEEPPKVAQAAADEEPVVEVRPEEETPGTLTEMAASISGGTLHGPYPDTLITVLRRQRHEPLREAIQARHEALREAMANDPANVAPRFGFGSLEEVAAEVDRLESALREATNGGPTVAEAAAAEEVDAVAVIDPLAELEAAAKTQAQEVDAADLPEFEQSELDELMPAIADLRAAYEDAPSEEVRSMLASNLQDALFREALLVRAQSEGK